MKKTSILLFILSVFSVNIHAQITAKEYGVLPIPKYFDTYVTEAKLKKVYNEDVSLNDLIKDSDNPLSWIVYSDRSKNKYYSDYGATKVKNDGYLNIGEPLVVYNVYGSWLEVGRIPERKNRKFVHNKLGWIKADYLILSPYAVIGTKGGPKKGMVLTSVNSFDKTDDVMKILENNHYYTTPDIDLESDNIATKFQFLFILKETNDAYLLSKTDNLSKQITKSEDNIRGWLPKGKVTKWNHRVCLEPSSDDDVVQAYKGKKLFVIDNEYHFKTYLEQGSLPNKDWAIREIELKNRRPFAYQMRMPILPDWDGEDKYNKKIAAIAQMMKEDPKPDETLPKDSLDIGDAIDRAEKIAILQQRLSENKEKLNKINILFVLDGTRSMKSFGPAIARSIKEFVKLRDSKLDQENKYRFALAVYRNYKDENNTPPLFEYVPFISSENKIIDKLENLEFDSKDSVSHEEAHYYGMINAIKRSKFNPKETNVLVLVGDAGNIKDDKKGLNRDKVINLLFEKNINLISYQVNYKDKTAYKTFNSDVYNYQKLLGMKHSSPSEYYTGATFTPSNSENTFTLKFNTVGDEDEKEMYPIFGKLKYASLGSSMKVRVFEDNLVSSLDEYVTSLTKVINDITDVIENESKGNSSAPKPREEKGKDKKNKTVFSPGFKEYLKRLGYTDLEIEMLSKQGEISAQGFLSLKLKGVEEQAFEPVIFISKEYKDILSDMLDDVSAAKGMKGSKARKTMYDAVVAVMKSIVGENVSTQMIDDLTFNEVWMQVLGVPFSGDTRMKNLRVHQILTELDDQEFLDFYSDFSADVEDFKKWDVTDNYSMWRKAGQTYYWIPLEEVPGCE